MIKWYDEIEKQIDKLQEEINGIEAGEVDAKNLSEVLDKDAPVTITTDLTNNKVTLGVNIDENTMEIDNGKLKVKSAGGSGKYSHRISMIVRDTLVTDLVSGQQFYIGFNIINNKSTTLTKQDLIDYINNNGNQYAFRVNDINGSALLTGGCIIARELYRQDVTAGSCKLRMIKLKYDSTNGLTCSDKSVTLEVSDTTGYYWNIMSDTIETL